MYKLPVVGDLAEKWSGKPIKKKPGAAGLLIAD